MGCLAFVICRDVAMLRLYSTHHHPITPYVPQDHTPETVPQLPRPKG
jgi:hypothetical protein